MSRFRVALAGLSCECCTFSPLSSRAADFAEPSGEELAAEYPFLADHPDVEFVPLRRARALPGGSIDPEFFEAFGGRLLDELAVQGPWDGIFLHLHGAAHVAGRDDCEGELLAAIRRAAGPDCLISASYDLHGNVSARVVDHLDVLTAYRTAPHVDWRETLARACDLLVRCLREGKRPHLAFVPVPVLLPGEMTSTEFEPAAGLYARIPGLIDRHGLLDASLLIGYVWADEPRATGSVVTVGFDRPAAEAAAGELARTFWDTRRAFGFGVRTGSADECIEIALAAEPGPVVLSDSGDNPTAGGAGDVPHVLERLLARNADGALVAGLADADAVAACVGAGAGAALDLQVGGKLDPVHGRPLPVRAEVLSLHEAPWSVGTAGELANRIAVIRVAGVEVVLTERRTPFHHLADFERLGLDPRGYRILVVKMGYLVPEIDALAALRLLVLSPGAVSQDLANLHHERIVRPMFPFDDDFDWTPPAGSDR